MNCLQGSECPFPFQIAHIAQTPDLKLSRDLLCSTSFIGHEILEKELSETHFAPLWISMSFQGDICEISYKMSFIYKYKVL